MFEKVAGMTGTARSEAAELWAEYKLGVVTVPPNRPNIRLDWPIQMYLSEEAKFEAAYHEVVWARNKFRPVLVRAQTLNDP
eukprot:6107244-Pyramimonas_sp.AAC.2